MTTKKSQSQKKASVDDETIVPPPSTVQVEIIPRVVLFQADGTPLKRQIGYRTT